MKRFLLAQITLAFGLFLTVPGLAQTKEQETPIKVTPCELQNAPATYNHKLIEVTGFFSHGFEDFSLVDPTCQMRFGVWLEYGGEVNSGTVFCCGPSAERKRSKPLTVEGIPVPLRADETFMAFDSLLQHASEVVLHGTVVGRFFSGKTSPDGEARGLPGYGHMGCCSLLIIQQVKSVDPHNRTNLDYSLTADQPQIKQGEVYQSILPAWGLPQMLEDQHQAEQFQQNWKFENPSQVAIKVLAHHLNLDEKIIKALKTVRQTPGRFVYQWKAKEKRKTYQIVVSRPYWLSFYAQKPERVTWVLLNAYEISK
ncbi:MAG: hypothetical protein K1Y36_17650 [Blastocatellia bacterium]|nr:hypothetical protein [Blastocatellia bacterium]